MTEEELSQEWMHYELTEAINSLDHIRSLLLEVADTLISVRLRIAGLDSRKDGERILDGYGQAE